MRNAQDLLARVEQVEDQKYLSALQMQQYRDAAFEAENQLSLTQSQQLEYQQQLSAIQQKLEQLPLEMEDKRRAIQRDIAGIEQSLLENEAQRNSVIVAPRAGTVSGMLVDAGQSVTAGQRLLNIIPVDAPLMAELWTPGQAVGMLRKGQKIAIRYHAFPHQDFGLQYGEIIEIAGSSTTAERILSSTGLQLNAPAYRVLATLEQQSMSSAQGHFRLRSNMTLDADLLQSQQRIYRMLFPVRSKNPGKNTAHDNPHANVTDEAATATLVMAR